MDFKFDKPFYSERELLKVVPVKRSTFYSWQSQWISFGNDPREMGKILIQNSPTSKRPSLTRKSCRTMNELPGFNLKL